MPPNHANSEFSMSRNVQATQTEESGTMTSTFEEFDAASSTQLDTNDEGVIERLSRLFSSSRQHRGTQTAKDPVACETEKLAFDIIYFHLGKRSASQNDDDVVKCLRYNVGRVLENHSIALSGMMSRIGISREADLHQGLTILSEEIFQNQVSWSRIVTFFAFGARLAQCCVENEMSDVIIDLVSTLSQLAVDKLTPFIRNHGGWATLCEAFPMQADFEGKIWRSLVITGMGLTAIATLLALQRSS